MVKAEILNIGDEILIGQILNTNSVWMARELNMLGVEVKYMSTVADSEKEILDSLSLATGRADIILVTGGLGPTKDDITKQCLARFFNTKLVLHEKTLEEVRLFFKKRGRELTKINEEQALLPENCRVLPNKNGTAPGMLFHQNNKLLVSMPGVPYEMKAIMLEQVLPYIKSSFKLPFIYHKTILTQGIGESFLAEKIADWEDSLGEKNIKLAYLPQPGLVRLRLSAKSNNSMEEVKEAVEKEIQRLLPLIKEHVYGFENYGEEMPTLQGMVSDMLRKRKKTFCIAESCTGGYIVSLFTLIPGCSDILKGGIVPYTNEAKHSMVKVDEAVFEKYGAVSEACVIQLAQNARRLFNADYALSVSGVAGPSGGTPEKPVGFVWIAVCSEHKTNSQSFQFGDNRERNIQATANAAMNMLKKFIELE